MHGRFSRRESYLGRKTREMVPMAPGFFSGRKDEGYWPYIRDVLIPAGKARAHFDLGDFKDAGGGLHLARDLATNSYLTGDASPIWRAVSTHDVFTNKAISTTGGPIAGRGYLESTSSTVSSIVGRLAFKAIADYTLGDNKWWAFAYWPTNPQVNNSGRHTIFSFAQYYAESTNNFPFSLAHNSGSLGLYAVFDGGGDFLPDITLNCGTLLLGQWNHIIVRWGSTAAPNNEVAVFLNGTKYSTTRSFGFATPNPQIQAIQLLSSVAYGGGTNAHRALGRIAELTTPYEYTAASLITDTQCAELWAAFQTGV